MNQSFYNDQAYIAESFRLVDEHTTQSARIAFLKVSSYKLSLVDAAFCASRKELTAILKSSLLNYTDPCTLLNNLGFFEGEVDN